MRHIKRRAQGYGDGPARGVYTAAASHLLTTQTKMGLWQDLNGWLVPKLSPLADEEQSLERLLEFRLAGTFLALYMIIMRSPVAKVSPHILLLLLCGCCPPDSGYLASVDASAASILTPWFLLMDQRGSLASLDQSTANAVRHLLAEYLGEPVRLIICICGFSFI
jgi:hypothetical protein